MFVRPITKKFALVGAACAVVGAFAINVAPAANAAGSGSISGYVWNDANRNGVIDAGESPFSGRLMKLYDSSGTNVASASTASDGSFSFGNLADGSWQIAMGSSDWQSLRNDWVPTTNGGALTFDRTVAISGGTAVNGNLGLRGIIRSTTDGQPITSATGSDGLKVESYDDVVSAQSLLGLIQTGTLRGGEAATTRVRFDLANNGNVTYPSYAGSEGSYSGYSAVVDTAYTTMLDAGDKSLFHEYGHAWAYYTETIKNQTTNLDSYLAARGLTGDSRIGSSKAWDPQEMLAEDYRQLFGTGAALTYPQMNSDIPRAADVPGLKDWLANTFATGNAGSGSTGGGSTGGTTTTTTPPAVAVTALTMNPSPVATSGTAAFSLNVNATVTVTIVDSSGVLVKTLASNVATAAGSQSFLWDRTNAQGRKVRGGTYRLSVSASANGTSNVATLGFTVSK